MDALSGTSTPNHARRAGLKPRFTPPHLTKFNLLVLCAVACFVSCSQEDGGTALPPGEHPMEFTAAGIALSVETKATTDNDWQGVDKVAVLVDGEVKPYDVQASDADSYQTATLTSQDPFYWQNTNPIQVSAWWPYTDGSTTMPAVVVQEDQSDRSNYDASDYIGATGTVQFSGSHALTFAHRTAKVVVKPLQKGNDMTDDELEGATIALVGVSTGDAEGATVTPYTDATTGDRLALLPAQTIGAGEAFILVTIGSNVYSYKPEAAMELKAGYQYTYTITVNKTGLGVSNAAISGWDNTTPAIGGEALPEDPTTLTDATVASGKLQGTGTEQDPYRIASAADLLCYFENSRTYAAGYALLETDIKIKTTSGWEPIDLDGIFDGGGHTISGTMTVNMSNGGYAALFEAVYGTVRNLIANVDITASGRSSGSNSYCGGIAAQLSYGGTIENCENHGDIDASDTSATANNYAGGIAGCVLRGKISGCTNTGTIKGGSAQNIYVGGIVGYAHSSTLSENIYGEGNPATEAGLNEYPASM